MKKTLLTFTVIMALTAVTVAQTPLPADSFQTDSLQNQTLTNTIFHFSHPLYILDGVEIDIESLRKLDQNDIAELHVVKDETSLVKYGEKGKNGVILITTRTSARSQRIPTENIE